MHIINKLTMRQLFLNKKRTLLTILGVILSSAMITATASGIFSGLAYLRQNRNAAEGEWHVRYSGLTAGKVKALPRDGAEVYTTCDLGYSRMENPKYPQRPYMNISSLDANAFHHLPMTLKEGRLPQTDGELAVTDALLNAMNTTLKVGDTVTLQVGRRYYHDKESGNEYELSHYSTFKTERQGEPEYLKELKTKTYKITGIMEEPLWFYRYGAGYLAVTTAEASALPPTAPVEVSVVQEHPTLALFSQAKETAEHLDCNYSMNHTVLATYFVIRDPQILAALSGVCIALFGVIMVASVFLIYNAFAISVAERSKQLGMLASIGATRRQKSAAVLLEGVWIGVLSIPLGIGAGILGLWVTFRLVSPLFASAATVDVPLRLVVNPWSLLLAAALSALTIFISVYRPALTASKTSPIEALRQTKAIRVRQKDVRTSPLTRKLFGIEGELALKNLRRNGRRYRTTVLSFIISIVLFLGVSGFSSYMTKMVRFTLEESAFDIKVAVNEGMLQKTEQETLLNAPSATKAWKHSTARAIIKIPEDRLTKEYREQNGFLENPGELTLNIVTVSKEEMAEKIKASGQSEQAFYARQGVPAILVNRTETRDANNTVRELPLLQWKSGDAVNIQISADMKDTAYGDSPIVVAGVVEEPLKSNLLSLYLPEEAIGNLGTELQNNMVDQYFYTTHDAQKTQDELTALIESLGITASLQNITLEAQSNRNVLKIVQVFTIGFVTLMTLISVANILNTLSASIALRRKEFAMLKSVGMTPKAFHKMIRFESLFYGLSALLWGVPVSLLVNYGMYRLVKRGVAFAFTLPWAAYLCAVAAVFLIIGATMAWSSKKVKKESILDALKDDTV